MSIRVLFYERTVIDPDSEKPYRYNILNPDSSFQSNWLALPEVPQVGDTLYMRGNKRVIARAWTFVGYGSMAWPYGESEPKEGHSSTVVVEAVAEGPFADEAELTQEERDEE